MNSLLDAASLESDNEVAFAFVIHEMWYTICYVQVLLLKFTKILRCASQSIIWPPFLRFASYATAVQSMKLLQQALLMTKSNG